MNKITVTMELDSGELLNCNTCSHETSDMVHLEVDLKSKEVQHVTCGGCYQPATPEPPDGPEDEKLTG